MEDRELEQKLLRRAIIAAGVAGKACFPIAEVSEYACKIEREIEERTRKEERL